MSAVGALLTTDRTKNGNNGSCLQQSQRKQAPITTTMTTTSNNNNNNNNIRRSHSLFSHRSHNLCRRTGKKQMKHDALMVDFFSTSSSTVTDRCSYFGCYRTYYR
mmetsp:Transcript_4338/g.4911  ORF Transcript_4338/g.4911 Transcript_4338/m.4911 type:complete len:105 (-) Transcript_4338:205-519(-)